MAVIPFMTLLMFSSLFAWGFVQHRMEPARAKSGRLHTFLVDPPTMLIVGLVSVLVGLLTRKGRKLAWAQFLKRRARIDAWLTLFLFGFWTFELLSYFDVMKHPFDPTRSGNDFMVNGYIEWLTGPIYHGPFPLYHYWWSWPLLAAMLLLQYGALRLGRALGYMTAYFNDMDRWSKPKR
ncbi:MAG TPA: hypothetical protein VL500_01320 [Candidatus Eisenbacteria bacterium]|jgi:hypothetical protein|nr:hypothetical protein [Candidatus Eisenbacteria bacterium]